MKNFKIQRLAEGENKGRLGVFEGQELVGIGSFGPEMPSASRESLTFLTESGGEAQKLLAERIGERMVELNQSYTLAELNVIQTTEGRVLWEQARAERLGQ